MKTVPHGLMGCTAALPAQVPQALVLATSFLELHPEAQFTILRIDPFNDTPDSANATFMGLRDLGLSNGEEWRLPMLYDSRELATVLIPLLLLTMLRGGVGTAAYFEFSNWLLGPLTNRELPDDENAMVGSEAIQNNFGDSGRSFIAARSGAERSLRLWSDGLRNANWVDSRPQDSVAPEDLFDRVAHRVANAPGFAVAYWNLDPQSLRPLRHGYQIAGHPLRSFDFRGYDSDRPHLLSKYQGLEPRILLSEYPTISKLCDEYREKVLRASLDNHQVKGSTPGFLPSGLRIDHRMLGLYREAVHEWRAGEKPEPPSPFGPGGEKAFLKWLNEPMGKTEGRVTRYMLAVREERKDVKEAFPDPLETDAAGFHDWYMLFGRHELDLPAAVIPPTAPLAAADAARIASDLVATPVNVAGFFRAELGIGVAARSILSALDAAGIPFNTISFDATANRQSFPFVDRASENHPADINIVCINPDKLSVFAEQTGPALRHGRYTIGVWFWEVEDFPKSFHGAFNYVDEIWVASDFMRETFLKVSPKPVFKFRLPVLTPQVDPSLSRSALGLPEKFVFLFSFDLLSVLERKNPLGLIKAFTTAFSNGEGPALVIKTINGDKRTLEMEKLRYAIRDRSDIILMDGYRSQIENNTLTALSDCYVSLHRSEGLGLTIAEAMALGKPAIATAYSGNLEFMTAENGYLCPAERCEVGPEREPYPADSHWSEPDVAAAAALLRYVYCHPEEAHARGRRAAKEVLSLHAAAAAGAIISERLITIRRRRARTGPVPLAALLEDRIDELEAENAKLRHNS